VPARVSPTERIRAEIDQLFTADQDLGQILEEVARLGAACCCRPRWKQKSPSSSAVIATPAASASGRDTAIVTPRRRSRPPPGRSRWNVQAARHRRGVRFAAARQGRDSDQCVGVAGHRGVRAWPVGPGCRGDPRRGDWLLIIGRGHLEHVLRVYTEHYNQHRPHRPRPFRPVSRSPMFGGGKSEGNPGRRLPRVPHLSPAAWSHSGR
jgi:hypothetical protein